MRGRRTLLLLGCIAALPGCGDPPANVVALAAPGLVATTRPEAIDWQPFGRVLDKHVNDDGRVDYFAIAHAETFDPLMQLYACVASVGPRTRPELFPTRADKLAYCINAHNLLAVLAVAPRFGPGKADPLKVSELPAALTTGHVFVLDGRQVTLDSIRAEMITPLLDGDPRPLLALCAARRNDPPLRRELYLAARLDEQLEDQLARVLRDSTWAQINYERRRLELPAGIAEHREYYWARYLAQPGRTRQQTGFVTVLLNLADARGRSWLSRALGYEVVAAEPADKFNNKPLFPGSPD